MFLEKNADINVKDKAVNTPFHVAVTNKDINVELMQLLTNIKGDINARVNSGRTTLYCSVYNGKLPEVQFLLNMNADVFCTSTLIDHLVKESNENSNTQKKH